MSFWKIDKTINIRWNLWRILNIPFFWNDKSEGLFQETKQGHIYDELIKSVDVIRREREGSECGSCISAAASIENLEAAEDAAKSPSPGPIRPESRNQESIWNIDKTILMQTVARKCFKILPPVIAPWWKTRTLNNVQATPY